MWAISTKHECELSLSLASHEDAQDKTSTLHSFHLQSMVALLEVTPGLPTD